ncbi:MAG: hypothetical protein PVI75_04605 [Gammaproteobacteria bacterium]|jgi:hypothetical protein
MLSNSKKTTQLLENAIKIVMEKNKRQQFYNVNALRELSKEVFYKIDTCINVLRVIVKCVAMEATKKMPKKSSIIVSYARARYILDKIGFGRCSEFADFAQAELCKIRELNGVKIEKHNFVHKTGKINKKFERKYDNVQLEKHYIDRLKEKGLGGSGTHAIVICHKQKEIFSNQNFMAIVDLQNKEYDIFNYHGDLYAYILKSEKLSYMRRFIEEARKLNLSKSDEFSSRILQCNNLDQEFKEYVNNEKLVNKCHAVIFNKVTGRIKECLKNIKNRRTLFMLTHDLMKIIDGEKKVYQYSFSQKEYVSVKLIENTFETLLQVQLLRKILHHYKKFTLKNVVDFFDTFKKNTDKDDKVQFVYKCRDIQKKIEAKLSSKNISAEIYIYKGKIALSISANMTDKNKANKRYKYFLGILKKIIGNSVEDFKKYCIHQYWHNTKEYKFIIKDLYNLLSGGINHSKNKKISQRKSITSKTLQQRTLMKKSHLNGENKLTQQIDFIFSNLLKKYKFVIGKEETKQVVFLWFSKKDINEITLEQQKLIAKTIVDASFSTNIFNFFCCNNNRVINVTKFMNKLNWLRIDSCASKPKI